MGCDIHVTLGTINLAAIAARPLLTTPSSGTALVLFGGEREIRGEDFELESLDDTVVDLGRHYALFNWLAGVRCRGLKPIMDVAVRRSKTSEFIEWLERSIPKQLNHCMGRLDYAYDIGDHSQIIHLVQDLLSFPYDQVVQVEPEGSYDGEIYVSHPDGMTYRECFQAANWFKFLDYCREGEYHFAIFGFDS